MRILIVAATAGELAPIVARCEVRSSTLSQMRSVAYRGHDIDMLVTGVGMVATAAWSARTLSTTRYEVALNVGLCGTFDRAIPLGTVVHVISDRLIELGAEDGDRFL